MRFNFLKLLQLKFNSTRKDLLQNRKIRQGEIDAERHRLIP
ncbi:hypothetical protein ACFOU2_09200 [Bacillus songklensis]|uniref:Malate synthase N-terminal domain-containing protein n=1 Tax=Bacillus songklensis TaxID=1069116 RepID=A0ABV8B293_9BACI